MSEKKPWHHPSYGGMSETSAKKSWEASHQRTLAWIGRGRPAPVPALNPSHITAASTIKAFWLVVSFDDPDRLEAWLADRSLDAPTLRTLYEERQNVRA
jgi:hypothetical protein